MLVINSAVCFTVELVLMKQQRQGLFLNQNIWSDCDLYCWESRKHLFTVKVICKANRILRVEATQQIVPFTRAVIECVLSLLLGLQHLSLWDDQCSTRGKDLPKDFAIADFFFEICSVRFNEIFSGMKNCSSCRWRIVHIRT